LTREHNHGRFGFHPGQYAFRNARTSYAAKCPPHIVKYGLHYYSARGERVLDPMVGSGTTLVQARIQGRHAYGYDIDPLARLIAQVKAHPLRDAWIANAAETVTRRTKRDIAILNSKQPSAAARNRATPPDFENRDYWFHPQVAEHLALLSYHITELATSKPIRDFLWVAFASLILAKQSVANARDVIHSRTHYFQHPEPPNVLEKFEKRLRLMRQKMSEYCTLCDENTGLDVSARRGDARHLRLEDETIDLVLTSPPYATALDYTRAHFLAVAWMQAALGLDLAEYRELAPRYVGAERGRLENLELVEQPGWIRANAVTTKLNRRSPRHARLIQRYWRDMDQVLQEIHRVLKDKKHAILIVCPSHIRRVQVPTHEVLAEMGRAHGLALKRRHTRTIYRHRRMLPYLQNAFGKRMSTEYILIFQKI